MKNNHLKRLDAVWVEKPVFFITTCTKNRTPILATKENHQILHEEWTLALEKHGWAIGRYVVMPDHVHFFCFPCEIESQPLSDFMRHWKEWTSKRIINVAGKRSTNLTAPIWQKEFFDHLIRADESYEEKWWYVKNNPVRAGLVQKSEDWLWQGEIVEF